MDVLERYVSLENVYPFFSEERNIRRRITKESHCSIVVPNPWEALTECLFVETGLCGTLHLALKTC